MNLPGWFFSSFFVNISLQVAERALYFWNNEYFCNLVTDNVETILPIMFAPLYENSKGHWNRWVLYISREVLQNRRNIYLLTLPYRTIHSMVYNAMKLFMEINPQLFDDCSHDYTELQSTAEAREKNRQSKWDRLQQLAQSRKSITTGPGAGTGTGTGPSSLPPSTVAASTSSSPPPPPPEGRPTSSRNTEDMDTVTHDSQQRLNALKLQDESNASKERRLRERDGQNLNSVSAS